MSYDISVIDSDSHEEILSLNWLRNPFGLCTFAEDNVGDGKLGLWHVCNDHSYEDMKDLDRKEFLRVVKEYQERLQKLEEAYFHFTLGAYMQFAPTYRDAMKLPGGWEWVRSSQLCWSKDGTMLRINVDRFQQYDRTHFSWGSTPVLEWYKEWMGQLVELAEKMQNPMIGVYISN